MYSVIETITPDIAREYLTHNFHNRKLKEKAIECYARDMKNGDWELNPQGISFKKNGNLFDGQNRLNAIIKAGVPVDMYVTYDVPDGCNVSDRGQIKTGADILRLSGIYSMAGSFTGVAIINMLFALAGRTRITDAMRIDFAKEYEEMICDAANVVNRGESKSICSKASISAAAFCALYCNIPLDGLVDFFTKVNTGFYNGDEESSAVVMRNFIIGEYNGSGGDRMRKHTFAVTTNAIKDFATRTPRYRKYKSNVEPVFWNYVKRDAVDKYLNTYK